MLKFDTANGGVIEVTRMGLLWDMRLRNEKGETVATVVLNSDDADALIGSLEASW